jgi:uncharacterized protein (DUF2267 family)
MQHDTFIGQVQHRAHLASRGEAETATRASLETLAERIPGPVAEHIADQLPREIGEHLRRIAQNPYESPTGHRMNTQEFFHRVADRAHTSLQRATHEARCVIEVADEATSGTLSVKVRPVLDDGLAESLLAGSTGSPHHARR